MHDHYDPRARFWLVLSLCALLVLGALQAARAQAPGDAVDTPHAAAAQPRAADAGTPARSDARPRLPGAHG